MNTQLVSKRLRLNKQTGIHIIELVIKFLAGWNDYVPLHSSIEGSLFCSQVIFFDSERVFMRFDFTQRTPHHSTPNRYRWFLVILLVAGVFCSGLSRITADQPPRHDSSAFVREGSPISDRSTPSNQATPKARLAFSSFLGGVGIEGSQTALTDSKGSLILVGNTNSRNYFTANAFQASSKDKTDSIDLALTKLAPTGEVIFSTYLSGKRSDALLKCILDTDDNIFVLISTTSSNLPLKNAFSRRGPLCLAKFDPLGQPVFITKLPAETDYSTLLLDQQNNAILVSQTYDRSFPLVKPLQAHLNNDPNDQFLGFDTVITKLGPTGRPIYSTFLGGGGDDRTEYAYVHENGDLTLVGSTGAQNFPLKNPFQRQNMSNTDLFITRISPTGQLIYSTLFGTPSFDDDGGRILVDSQDNLILYGRTTSALFPLYNQGDLPVPGDEFNLYILKINPTGQRIFAKVIGGSGSEDLTSSGRADQIPEIFLDREDNIYFFGRSTSLDLPVKNPAQATLGGGIDWIFGKLSPDGELQHLSYWGGKSGDQLGPIVQDANGDFVILQRTSENSMNMPEVNPIWSSESRRYLYLAKIGQNGQVVYATRMPSEGEMSLKVDSSSNVVLVGVTSQPDLPLANAAFSQINQGTTDQVADDLFISKIGPDGSLVFSTYLGGSGYERLEYDGFDSSLHIDSQGNIFVIGKSVSVDFPEISPLQNRPSKTTLGEASLVITGFTPTGQVLFSTFFGGQEADYVHSITSPQPGKINVGGNSRSPDFPVVNPIQRFQGNGDGTISRIEFDTQP